MVGTTKKLLFRNTPEKHRPKDRPNSSNSSRKCSSEQNWIYNRERYGKALFKVSSTHTLRSGIVGGSHGRRRLWRCPWSEHLWRLAVALHTDGDGQSLFHRGGILLRFLCRLLEAGSMKFPLYNECPNCGGRLAEHSESRFNCSCSMSHNTPIYEAANKLAGRSDPEALLEYQNLRSRLRNMCPCQLSPSDVAQAISIQAAVEVALARQRNA